MMSRRCLALPLLLLATAAAGAEEGAAAGAEAATSYPGETKKYDAGKTGAIGYDEFVDILAVRIAHRSPEDELKKAFELFDEDGTGR